MKIYLLNQDQYDGPYSESEMITRIKEGSLASNVLAWCEGLTGPLPLIEILCKSSTASPTKDAKQFSAADLRLIADNYTKLLIIAAVWLVGLFVPMSESVGRMWLLIVAGCWIRFGWQLSKGLQRKSWPWVIWSLIPLGNFYALVRILYTAAKTLKENGVPVKFLIPDQGALAEVPQQKSFDASLN